MWRRQSLNTWGNSHHGPLVIQHPNAHLWWRVTYERVTFECKQPKWVSCVGLMGSAQETLGVKLRHLEWSWSRYSFFCEPALLGIWLNASWGHVENKWIIVISWLLYLTFLTKYLQIQWCSSHPQLYLSSVLINKCYQVNMLEDSNWQRKIAQLLSFCNCWDGDLRFCK